MAERKLQVLPAVDLLGAEAVRLEQGDFARVATRADPEELVRRFASAGAGLIHVVDLDGARRGEIRPSLIGRLAQAAGAAKLQVSGGIRSVADAERLLDAGAARVVVGTAASGPESLGRFVAELDDMLVVAIDVRGGRVAARGWLEDTGLCAGDVARSCADAGVARILCTSIERDGMLGGPDLGLLHEIRDASGGLPLLAAGGIRSQSDLAAVEAAGCEGAVVGRALLDGSLPLGALA
jgi:phosphoribosylformimino-5-aminoimidazole carboxamide ribotide isomerase